MIKYISKNHIFSLIMVSMFFISCKGQTLSNKRTNNPNPITKKVQHPNIVRTLGARCENVNCQLLDKEGNVWFSINGEGVYRYDGKLFTNFTTKDGLCNNNVGPIIQDRAENILFGTNEGICKYDGKIFITIPKTEALSITSLLEDRKGNLWFGVMNQGVYRFDGINVSNFLYMYKHPFLGDKYEKLISDILEDKEGNIWFSSWNAGGAWRFDGKNMKSFLPSLDYYQTDQDKRRNVGSNNFFVQSEDYISDDMIFSMTEDHLGNIWFATRNHGVCRFDGKTFTNIGRKEGFHSDGAYAILEDKKGRLWFTTEKDGIWCYDGKIFKNFNEKASLINQAVMNAIEDKEGNLWFGTKWFGLSRFDGKTFTTFSRHEN
jgi:ligand-binding sensor domain-containing protein